MGRYATNQHGRSLRGNSVRKILILEDDPSVAGLYAEVLGSAGHEVIVHTSFEEARTYLKLNPPDALLADVRVGEYNGLQLAILFRSLSPHAIILVVSGHDDPVIRREAAAIGAEFFVKPVDVDTLTLKFE